MLNYILLIPILFSLATLCFKALGHILLTFAWEWYHLGIFPPARFFCSLAKLFFPKGDPSEDKRWVEESIAQLRQQSQALQRELDLLQLETNTFRHALAVVQNTRETLSGDVMKSLYERRDALAEDAGKLSERHRLYELDYAEFIRNVRNMGPWATAYLFHERI